MGSSATFDDLVCEGASVPTEGWDFSWFDGRATEERPSWGYAKLLADRMTRVPAVLDIQTGGGEVLHEKIQREGPFVAHAERFLIEARKLRVERQKCHPS